MKGVSTPGFLCGFCGYPVADGWHTIRPRKAITPAMRSRVWAASEGICAYCETPLDPKKWHADHVVAWSRGGPTEEGNLVAACPACNHAKRDHLIEEWLPRYQNGVSVAPGAS